jgi:hypothetical protein
VYDGIVGVRESLVRRSGGELVWVKDVHWPGGSVSVETSCRAGVGRAA